MIQLDLFHPIVKGAQKGAVPGKSDFSSRLFFLSDFPSIFVYILTDASKTSRFGPVYFTSQLSVFGRCSAKMGGSLGRPIFLHGFSFQKISHPHLFITLRMRAKHPYSAWFTSPSSETSPACAVPEWVIP